MSGKPMFSCAGVYADRAALSTPITIKEQIDADHEAAEREGLEAIARR